MSSTGAAAGASVSKPAALKQLVSSLRCYVCTKLPKNTHICPHCSEMFCFQCISIWLLRQSTWNRCARCNGRLRQSQLIKMHCFESLERVQVDFGRLKLVGDSRGGGEGSSAMASSTAAFANQSTGSAANASFDAVEFESETKEILVGRSEPVAGLPPAVEGTFRLRNVHHCRLMWVCSERVVDSMGFVWRMKVAPKGEQDQNYVDVYVEMLSGEVGFYEIMIELTNFNPRAFLIKAEADTETLVGRSDFLNKSWLPRGKVDLMFRYTIRPANFQAKVQIQKRLLYKHEQCVDKLKGEAEIRSYVIPNYANADLDDPAFKEFNDQLGSEWRFGIHGTNNFAEFQMILSDGLAGIYEVVLTMVHPTPGCEKQLRYEKRHFQLNQKNLFNFGIRWDQLDEHGYVLHNGFHCHVRIQFSIRPIQVDLKRVQDRFATEFTDDEDDDGGYDYGDDDDYDYDNDNFYDYDDDSSGAEYGFIGFVM